MAENQQVSRDWWRWRREAFVCITSDETRIEAARGNARQAQLRLDELAGLPMLSTSPAAAELASRFIATGSLPPAAKVDAAHLGVVLFLDVFVFLRREMNRCEEWGPYCPHLGLWR